MESKATVTIPLEELQQIIRAREEAQELVASLQVQLAQEKNRQLPPEDLALAMGLLSAKDIIGFAVSNLSPEIIRGWPWPDLIVFAETLKRVPALSPHAKEQAEDFIRFAHEVEQIERSRKP